MQAVESCAGVVDHGADVGRAARVATDVRPVPAARRLPLSLRTPRSASSGAGRRRSHWRGVLTGLLGYGPIGHDGWDRESTIPELDRPG
jgi:hypothetical protein